MSWMSELPVTVVQVVLRSHEAWVVSRVPAATVRSALLRQLHGLLCVRRNQECEACPLRRDCPFPGFWHRLKGDVARWWLAVEPLHDRRCGRNEEMVVTFGTLGEVPVPYVLIEAWLRMAKAGLGRDRVRHTVQAIRGGSHEVVREGNVVGAWPSQTPLDQVTRSVHASGVTSVQLESPHPAAEPPTVATWLSSGIGRMRGLARSMGVRLPVRWPAPSTEPTPFRKVVRVRAARDSQGGGRQSLSGWVGTLGLEPETVERFGDLLCAVEVVGASRSATFGLGDVRLRGSARRAGT